MTPVLCWLLLVTAVELPPCCVWVTYERLERCARAGIWRMEECPMGVTP